MKRLPRIHQYKVEPDIDYCEDLPQDNGLTVGCCEVIGARETQEDAVVIDSSAASDKFAALNSREQADVMKETFAELQKKCGQENEGSCACIATGTIVNNQAVISTSFVGDSVAYLIVLDKFGQLKFADACNKELHDANNPTEVRNIEKGIDRNKGMILLGRLHGGLAVTRALGDNGFDKHGISHKPDTTKTSYQVESDDLAFMVVGCDGVMEHLKGENVAARSAQELGALFSKQIMTNSTNRIATTASDLAEAIVANAIVQKSEDNVSAMVVPLAPGKSTTLGVFDGHGGYQVAVDASNTFSGIFAAAVNNKQLEVKKEAPVLFDTDELELEELEDELEDDKDLEFALDVPDDSDEEMELEDDHADLEVLDETFDEEIKIEAPLLEPVESKKIAKLNQSVKTYFNELLKDVDEKYKNGYIYAMDIDSYRPNTKHFGAALTGKMTIVHELYKILNQPRPKKATEDEVIKEFQECLARKEDKKTNAEILNSRRYVSRGVVHATQVFFKAIIAAVPFLIDLLSFGKTHIHHKLFPVKGKAFVQEVSEVANQNNKSIKPK